MSKENSSTPMMEQYFNIKKDHRDALLFFRLGDFYEMFYEDAKVASQVLEIALTSRQKVPMCGIPYHAASSYLQKLVRHGYKVAVCEQVEDPKKAKGVVRREVIKILTPGTAIELDTEEIKENTYISSLLINEDGWGLSNLDIASGHIITSEHGKDEKDRWEDELFKIAPKEIIFPESQKETVKTILEKNGMAAVIQSPLEDWAFDYIQAENILMDHFQVRSLAGFGLSEKRWAASSAGALLFYLKKLRKENPPLIHSLSFVQASTYMILDAASIKNLELIVNLRDGKKNGALLDIIDFTVTPMGGRLLRSWLLHPLMDLKKIKSRQDAVEEILGHAIERYDIRELLKGIFDLERLTGKISLAVAHPRDLISLKKSLVMLPDIQKLLSRFSSRMIKLIKNEWDNAKDIRGLIERSILEEPAFILSEGGIIRSGYNAELDELRAISRSGKTIITDLEKKERERTGISSLKIRYNRVFGYYIDVTKPNLPMVPSDYIRKQTLVNSERFITPELKEYEDKVLNAEERIKDIEYNLFLEIREKVSSEALRLQQIASAVARIDTLFSLAELASQGNYLRPKVTEGDGIHILEGRHPVIEVMNQEPFIPNDLYIDRKEDQILIITGPNMGGKSTYLRQVALICILAQMGSFVPVKQAEIGIVDRIFTRIGAMDYLSVGQSTFMVEMLETANILNNATSKSLILLDEVGRGTSTFDGLSLAWAVTEYLHEREAVRPKTLFATHYHELTELSLTMDRIKNYHVSVKEKDENVIFLRKIVSGPSDQSYGIHVAKLAGIPRAVIDRAKEILFNLEKKELDDSGKPKIAYKSASNQDDSQFLLFQEDREMELLKQLQSEILSLNLSSLTPLQALNLLDSIKARLEKQK
ncbi:MAG: DNA mismatch repair protein MutS [Candidatus Aminicenantes bacterium]|nr:DNA mismatch repair protein MutS [Candidatus Aminicenantes bacterium]